jgi:hypothetical protein
LRCAARLAPVYCCILVRLAQSYGDVHLWQGPHTHTSRPFTSAQQEASKDKMFTFLTEISKEYNYLVVVSNFIYESQKIMFTFHIIWFIYIQL